MIPRYTLPEMGAIWSDAARFEAMLRVELAVARAQAARGQVPPEALAAIETRARVDVDRIAEIERTTDHDVIAFVSQVAETVGPEGRYLHLGLTSSDVVDTGLALQLRAAGERLLLDCDRLLAVLIARARAEAGTVMMGRTHSVHAEPTTFGLKLAGWAFELDRGRVRLAAAVDEIATGKISGPVGTYSHLGPDIEAEVLGALGLHADPVSTQIVQRDRHAGAAHRDRDPRRLAGALRDRDPQPPAHRDRRGPGAVPDRPEGLVGDAPQAQPDPVRADRRARPAAARLRPHRARGPAAVARARHQPLERRAGHPARRDDRPRLHARADDRRSSTASSSAPSGCARTSRAGSGCTRRRGSSSRSWTTAACRARTPTPIVQRASLRAADERAPLRDLLAVDPGVAQRLSLAQLDACFDEAAFLRHVPEVIARLDGLAEGLAARTAAAKAMADAG